MFDVLFNNTSYINCCFMLYFIYLMEYFLLLHLVFFN